MREQARRNGRIPSTIPGRRWMLCCYGDCGNDAKGEYAATVQVASPGPGEGLEAAVANTYVFCCWSHRSCWVDEAQEARRESRIPFR